MGKVTIDQVEYRAVLVRIAKLEKLLNQPVASLYARVVKGVKTSPTIVLPASIDTYDYIDGLDITADVDSKQVMIDLTVELSMTATPSLVNFLIEIDGSKDILANFSWIPSTGGNYIYTSIIVAAAQAGNHRYRAMMSSNTGVTVTFTGTSRYMRVTGIINNRRRFLNVS